MSNAALNWAYRFNLETRIKFTLVTLAEHHNGKTGQCNPSQDTLVKRTGQSLATIKRQIKVLQDSKILSRKIENDPKTGYRTSSNYKLALDKTPDELGFGYDDDEPTAHQCDLGSDEPTAHTGDLGSEPIAHERDLGDPSLSIKPGEPKCQTDEPKCQSRHLDNEPESLNRKIEPEEEREAPAAPALSLISDDDQIDGPKTTIPNDWKPKERQIAYAREKGLNNYEISREAEKFLLHWLDKGTKRKGWSRSWMQWVLRSVEYKELGNKRNDNGPKRISVDDAFDQIKSNMGNRDG